MFYQILAKKYPNGISFDPMSLKLICAELGVTEEVLIALKKQMFCINDRWFCKEMIAEPEQLSQIEGFIQNLLEKANYFSVAIFFAKEQGQLNNIHAPQDCTMLLQHLGFAVVTWHDELFCLVHPENIDDYLASTVTQISHFIEENGGTVRETEILEAFEYISAQTLEHICQDFLPEIYLRDIDGIRCLSDGLNITLPEDFAEKITDVIDRLFTLGKKASAYNLAFLLDFLYLIDFLKEYNINDEAIFIRLCTQYYQGQRELFIGATGKEIKEGTAPTIRKRRPNNSFKSLGIPIGATLIFAKDPSISCTVADEKNQVFYQGQQLAISTLATSLAQTVSANGFARFCYQGQLLTKYAQNDENSIEEHSSAEEDKHKTPAQRNTFHNMGIPVGATLVFTKDNNIFCLVEDEKDLVNYQGNILSLSELAEQLLERPIINSSIYFTYEGKLLVDYTTILSVRNNPLSSDAWAYLKYAASYPQIDDWTKSIEEGEDLENLAQETKLPKETIWELYYGKKRFFTVCRKNNIPAHELLEYLCSL